MGDLITGGAGFIGSHLCDRLIGKSNQVIVLDDLSLGRKENIAHLCSHDEFQFIEGDILQPGLLEMIFDKHEVERVFHLAANSDIAESNEKPDVDLDRTFLTTYRLLDCMKNFDVKKIIFASTSAVYGEADGEISESFGPLQPVSHYGAGKLASEAFVSSFVENYGLTAWIARFPNVVGERATHGVIFDFIKKLKANPMKLEVLGDGEQCKPYLYVKDLVDAILFMHEKSRKKLNVYNLGVSSRTKVKRIARIVIDEMGLNAEIQYTGGSRGWVGDVPEFSYNLSKIHDLGWASNTSSDEAVRKAVRAILRD